MRVFVSIFAIFVVMALALKPFNIVINATPSMPFGLYIESLSQKIKHGDIVKFDLDADISTKTQAIKYTNSKALLKYVIAMADDEVEINEKDILIVRKAVGNLRLALPKKYDSKGEKTISFLKNGIIPKGKIFVVSNHDGSFDSRYFGLIEIDSVTKMQELLTF